MKRCKSKKKCELYFIHGVPTYFEGKGSYCGRCRQNQAYKFIHNKYTALLPMYLWAKWKWFMFYVFDLTIRPSK